MKPHFSFFLLKSLGSMLIYYLYFDRKQRKSTMLNYNAILIILHIKIIIEL